MMSIWKLIGNIGYYVTLPALYVQLRWTKRTRVFIRSGNELVVVKGWLSHGGWSFPGGGLKRHEDPKAGAVREVLEETGISLDPKLLKQLFEGPTKNRHGLRYHCIAYGIELSEKPDLTIRPGELIAAEWKPIDELLAKPDSDRLLRPALDAWDKVG